MSRIVTRVCLSLVLTAVFAEGAALVVHYAQTGWLFYRNPHLARVPAPAGADGQALTGEALQPYFGPTHRAGLPFDVPAELRWPGQPDAPARTNNFGFVSASDYPMRRASDRQFFIGVMGGSVGNWFCQVGVPRLFEALRRSPALAGRDLVPVCLAHEGYKQPQQLLVLSYFLSLGQPLDLVINIDGFNEVALGGMNDRRGYDFSMPSAAHMDPMVNLINRGTLTPEKAELLGDISRGRQALARWARRANGARFAATRLVAERVHAILAARQQTAVLRFDALPSVGTDASLVRMVPRRERASADQLWPAIARQWAEASAAMQALLAARHIAYLHVLQPNQYASARAFTAEERATAFIDGSPFKPGAEAGYPQLLAEPAQAILRAAGVRFLDATRVFDAVAEPVYLDNCCHFTRTGNAVLADAIARALAAPGAVGVP